MDDPGMMTANGVVASSQQIDGGRKHATSGRPRAEDTPSPVIE